MLAASLASAFGGLFFRLQQLAGFMRHRLW